MNISEELKSQAISCGLCSPWQSEWGEPSKDELVEKYVRGIDFAIEHNFPSLEYMVRNFDDCMNKHGVYVSQELSLKNPRITVANGSCTGDLLFNEFAVGRVYVRHNSDLTIHVSGMAKVFISLYDNCKIKVVQDGMAKVYIYKRGGSVDYVGEVLIRDGGSSPLTSF